ncbi:DUF1292 domain-containing protein [Aminicella lysinilytica]|uniref:Uncharacterized protein DUF1292 n=1 Tax=Aminicella lysinilytica TaxID=433323 RepID=A0A4R6QAD8_9FIRM|nr:DUF1292 domain-containing protein [Aminicella lysinilytica]NLD11175.1 DUF1292 domain-containing protein [Clostridiales bacterium]TDP59588.1 uncharacterized protein DUF1292 [Aminicella lysinilytica]
MAENRNEQAEEAEIITLEFDDGTKMDCEVMGIFDFEKKDYIALIPDDDSDDVYIYGYEENKDGSFELLDIVDENLFGKVAKEFQDIMEEPEEE